MKAKLLLIMTIFFSLLTFIGAGYVLFNHGEVNAGYACVPMALAIACLDIFRSVNNK